ncbi:hypothetical protein PQX77_013286 [Marasmius sp. AFHP31]|nr:hypothetical protein PQX77_013286 [Marasmius sp. AFHP31]
MSGMFSNVMRFFGGGQACPGMKFVLLEIKLVLSILIPSDFFESFMAIQPELQKDALSGSDPLALNSILVRNQQNFPESFEFSGYGSLSSPAYVFSPINKRLFGVIHHGNSLASVWGEDHKKGRNMLDPVFNTAAFVSNLTPIFYKIAFQVISPSR